MAEYSGRGPTDRALFFPAAVCDATKPGRPRGTRRRLATVRRPRVGPALTVAAKTDYNTGLCCGAVIYASKQQDSSPAQRDGCPARKPAGPCISAAAAAATN